MTMFVLPSPESFAAEVRPYVGEVKTILDVGCCNGGDSLKLKSLFPNAEVHAFEANPAQAQECENRLRGTGIFFYPFAAHEVDGEVPFFTIDPAKYWNVGASSLYRASGKFDHMEKYTEFQVETKTRAMRLDTWAREYGVASIDLAWIDVQGAELSVLKGMGNLLKTLKAVQVEVEYQEMYDAQPLFHDVRRFLEEAGFFLVKHYVVQGSWHGDAIFVRRSLAELPW